MTKQDNITIAIDAVKALVDAGYRLHAQVGENTLKIQTDSLTYAEDVLEELQLEVGQRIDNTFDTHILYLDNHNKPVAKYNYDTGILLLSIHRNAHAFAEYCMHVQHDGVDIFESPLAIINLLAQIKA